MRALVLSILASLAAAAGPAAAQNLQQQMDLSQRAAELRAQQDMADRRAVILENRLTTLEAQARTQQAFDILQAQRQTPPLPEPPAGGPPPQIDTGALASMPDDALAASNARVRAAAENRR
jgi:hypothetical protein